jgi:hypothetical protein
MKKGRSKLKFTAGIAMVFFVGVLAGVLGAGTYFEARIEKMFDHGPPRGKRMLERLTQELKLTSVQIKEIKPIIQRFEEKASEVKQNFFPQMKPILDQLTNRIREKLNNEQRRKFDRIHEKMKKRFPKGPPFPPPPFKKHRPGLQ